MYIHYIDDQNIVAEEFGPGSRYNIIKEEEKIEIVKELVESDVEVRGDKKTFKIMREVGDSLEGMIRLTAHYPSNHPGCHWLISMFRLVCCCRYCTASPIAAVQTNVLLPPLLIVSLVPAASLFR